MPKYKIMGLRLTEAEYEVIKQVKGEGMSDSDFLKQACRTSVYVRNKMQILGENPDIIFREKQRGGRRPGSGNPNWGTYKPDED